MEFKKCKGGCGALINRNGMCTDCQLCKSSRSPALLAVNYNLNDALSFDAFQGDFGYGDEHTFENKIVTARKDYDCHNCDMAIAKGEKHRVMKEKAGGEMNTYRWCGLCCVAMILDDRDGGCGFDHRATG